jgi:hypothetical protein
MHGHQMSDSTHWPRQLALFASPSLVASRGATPTQLLTSVPACQRL